MNPTQRQRSDSGIARPHPARPYFTPIPFSLPDFLLYSLADLPSPREAGAIGNTAFQIFLVEFGSCFFVSMIPQALDFHFNSSGVLIKIFKMTRLI